MDVNAVHASALAGDADGLAGALSAAARLGESRVLTAADENGWTALHCATISGDRQTVDMLLTAGANINEKSSDAGDTPLHFAAVWDHREVAHTLLKRGALVDEENRAGGTALHKACEYGAENVVAELLHNEASCSKVDSFGQTPLHVAAKHNASAVVLQLMAKGADSDATDKRGRRPVDLASGPTAVLLTPSSDDHALMVWLADKGMLQHAELFSSHNLTVHDLIKGPDDKKLEEVQMPVGVRIKVLKLMKELSATERERATMGCSASVLASVRPLGYVDWQMTEGGEWYKNTTTPLLSTGYTEAATDYVNVQVIDPWDYDDTEWTQKYGKRADSPARSEKSNRSASAPSSSPGSKPQSQSQPEPEPEPEPDPGSKPEPQPEPEPELEAQVDRSEDPRAGDITAPWENDSDDEETAADNETDGVRPWFRS